MQRIARYEVVRELGQGGMGAVYLGRDPELRRSVALKLLHHDAANAALKQEARTLAALNHPGIVTIFEIGEHEGRQFIAMEYLAGSTLRALLGKRSRDEIVAICGKVAVAVAAAHEAGILHRDIKPENVVVGDKGVVKVVDFGVARRLHGDASLPSAAEIGAMQTIVDVVTRTLQFHAEDDRTVTEATHTIFGTPAYMAPEVLTGEPVSEASDVYSLGVMLYESLAGKRPFDAPSLAEFIARAVEGGEPAARLDDPLGELVERMLDRDPAKRPSLSEISRRLEVRRFATAPSSRPRSRAGWIVAAVVAVLAIAGGAIAWTMRASPQRHVIVVGIPRFVADVPSYGAQQPAGDALADAFALLLANRGTLKLVSVHQIESADDPAQLGIEQQIRCTITERDGWLDAKAQIVDANGKVTREVSVRKQVIGGLAPLLFDLGEQLWPHLAPGIPFDRKRDPARAMELVATGKKHMMDRAWFAARAYLDLAVLVDPKSFDAWSTAASILAWSQAPQELVDAAVAETLRLAPDGPRKKIWEGASLYYQREFRRALDTLRPLEAIDKLAPIDRRDLNYYLGEAHWHNGDHEAAVPYFEGILETDLTFKPAAIHLGQYAIARRKIERAAQLMSLQDTSQNLLDFAAKRYGEVIARGKQPEAVYAELVLGKPPTGEDKLPPSLLPAYRYARALGDGADARELWEPLWKTFADQATPSDGALTDISLVVETLLAAERAQELDEVAAYLAKHPSKRANELLERVRILAAPLAHRPAVAPGDHLTTREQKVATAIAAEIAGDRARAATLLAELVHDPSFSWDYGERAALVRNLVALGRRDEVRALCNDTLHPAIFQLAYLPLRRTCMRVTH